jgi:molecular chaperone GrpE
MDNQEQEEKKDVPAADAAAEPVAADTEAESENTDVKPDQAEADAKSEQAEADAKPEQAGADAAEPEAAEKAQAEPDWKAMCARTMADFDNFRKRTARDREELFKSAAGDVLKDLLPTVDNLALALDKAADKEDPFVKGVQLVYDGLVKMLADHGAVPVDSLGEPLDTNFHEAIATLPSPDIPEGHVMTEVKRGWLLNGKVLRAAQVVVSAGKGE